MATPFRMNRLMRYDMLMRYDILLRKSHVNYFTFFMV